MTVRTQLSDNWTTAQDEQLRALARANTPYREIAERLSRTPEAVFKRAHELGVRMQGGGGQDPVNFTPPKA